MATATLRVLPRAINADLSDTEIDIVAVPAIGANPRTTWQHPSKNESLYRDLPKARLYLYSFPVESLREFNINYYMIDLQQYLEDLPELGNRPIHLVGHSTGGLIIKGALNLLREGNDKAYSQIARCCFGVAFFGTPPYYGSTVLSEPTYKKSIANILDLGSPMGSLLRQDVSADNMAELMQFSEDFAPFAMGLKRLWTFVEAKGTKLKVAPDRWGPVSEEEMTEIESHVVDRRSATLSTLNIRVGSEQVIEVSSNHTQLCRFGGDANALPFLKYLEELRSLIGGAKNRERIDLGIVDQEVVVDIHLFYNAGASGQTPITKLWSESPSLYTLLERGPKACLERRLPATHKNVAKKRRELPMIVLIPPQGEGGVEEQKEVSPRTLTTNHSGRKSASDSVKHTPEEAAGALEGPHISSQAESRHDSDPRNELNTRPQSKANASPFFRESDFPPQGQGYYTLPDLKKSIFRWIHVPANNMFWVPKLVEAVAKEVKEPILHRSLLHRQVWDSRQNVPRHHSPHGRFMRPSCQMFSQRPSDTPGLGAFANLTSPVKDSQFSIYFPYLHWDTFGGLVNRNRIIEKRMKELRPSQVDEEVSNGSLEHKLIWHYLTNSADLPLHHRRSLDQYGYPTLASTSARDNDQVLYKRTKPVTTKPIKTNLVEMMERHNIRPPLNLKGPTGSQADGTSKVLMVDQLWCWILDSDTILTFFPAKEKDGYDPSWEQADLRSAIYNDVNGDPRFATQCKDCFDFAALAMHYAVTVFLEQSTHRDLQVFRIFEEAISDYAEQQTTSFKDFRDSQSQHSIKDEDSIRGILSSLHNHADLTALLELRDIEDELGTLDKLFSEQFGVLKQMIAFYNEMDGRDHVKQDPKSDSNSSDPSAVIDSSDKSPTGREHREQHATSISWLCEACMYIEKYRSQVEIMRGGCKSAQNAYQSLLDMKQKQANVAEASLARMSAQVASEQSRAVMIFTIFTIIFLPLSFFTSLFGMNAADWSGQPTNPHLRTIFLIAGCISAAVIFTALTMAFNRPIWILTKPFFKSMASICCGQVAGFIFRWKTSRATLAGDVDGTNPSLESGLRMNGGQDDMKFFGFRSVPTLAGTAQIGANRKPKSNTD